MGKWIWHSHVNFEMYRVEDIVEAWRGTIYLNLYVFYIYAAVSVLKPYIFGLFTDKERELGDAQAEIKALKYSDRLKEKAVEEVYLYIS